MEFTENEIEKVWNKARKIDGINPDKHRLDVCGARIDRDKYGDRSSGFGWEIDHIICQSNGGSDDLNNLQPLQWQNNASKSDKASSNPDDYCVVQFVADKKEVS